MGLFIKFIGIAVLHVLIAHADSDFYSYTATDSDGKEVSLEKYRGKVTLVVNVASECGFTEKHYRGLVRAKKLLSKEDKFEVLAFPCNQFGAQEPQNIREILKFARSTYDVNFPIFAKINVIEKNVPEAWRYLTDKSGAAPNWNFFKYLVDQDGKVLSSWGPWNDVEEIFPKLKEAVATAVKASSRAPANQAATPEDRLGQAPAPGKPPARSEARPPSNKNGMIPGAPSGANTAGAPNVKPPSSPPVRPPSAQPPRGHQSHDDL